MEYIKARGIYYANELSTIKKKDKEPFQPIFEAITNSLEAIYTKFKGDMRRGSVYISFYTTKGVFEDDKQTFLFDKIEITDNGIGIDSIGYNRLINLRDDTKKMSSKGTGRVQFIHSFDETEIQSTSKDDVSKTGYKFRCLTLSKSQEFLSNNAILRLDEEREIKANDSSTIVRFTSPIDKRDSLYYSSLYVADIKKIIIDHFLAKFCDYRNRMPKIVVSRYVAGKLDKKDEICLQDIPEPNKEIDLNVPYSTISNDTIVHSNKEEKFRLKSFVIPSQRLAKNSLEIVSKGEHAMERDLTCIADNDVISGNRYLFLLSGDYIDNNNDDTRGNLHLLTGKQFKKKINDGDLFDEGETVLLDDIDNEVNTKIIENYKEISNKNKEKDRNIDDLKQMFLLDPATVDSFRGKIKISDSDETILTKIYESESSSIAKRDAELKKSIDSVKDISPSDKDYECSLQKIIDGYTTLVSLQNRTSLTRYVARRRIVLEVFTNLLKKLSAGEKMNELNFHRLIFRKNSTNDCPESSDMWLLSDDYVYFKGASDKKLGDILYENESIFKESFTKEEMEYKIKYDIDAANRKPDILLFPSEGKCIIIEFKAPDVLVSNHLAQVSRYAHLIHNLSREKYHFDVFYGYLIGEHIDIDDVQMADPDYKSAGGLDFLYKPHQNVIGKFGHGTGDLYMEIIKYSVLLQRASLRNKIFIDKMEGTSK